MFQCGFDFVFKFLAVDRAAAPASSGRVAGLDHEVGDDAMKDDIIVVASLGQGREVLAGLGSMIVVELDNNRSL